jgi:hypothetical protein
MKHTKLLLLLLVAFVWAFPTSAFGDKPAKLTVTLVRWPYT